MDGDAAINGLTRLPYLNAPICEFLFFELYSSGGFYELLGHEFIFNTKEDFYEYSKQSRRHFLQLHGFG